MSVKYADSALGDLAALLAYLDEKSAAGGRNVMRSIVRTVESIGDFPDRGPVVMEGVRVAQAGRYPYLIYWQMDGGQVMIVHVRHTARKPWSGGAP